MSEDSSKTTGAVAAILAALPGEVKGTLSAMLLFFAFYAMMYALINMPAYFKNLVQPPQVKELCWDLREVQGAAFKINKCTGETQQLEIMKQPSAASGPSK